MADIAELKKESSADLAQMKPKDQVRHLLEKNKLAIAQAMPRHMNPERLMKVAQTAVTTTPALLECYVPTLLGGIIQCAQMGLEPNTVLGHAYLVPYKNKKKNRKEVQVILGYKGLIDLARRSGQVVSIAAHAVRKGDAFEYEYGLAEKLRHIPAEGERGEITHFYAVAHMKDGGHAFEVMTRKQVEKIRDAGNRNEVWSEHFEEMGRKTAIRRLAKYLPLSVEFATSIMQDGQAAPTLEADGSLVGEFSVVEPEGGDDADESARGTVDDTDDKAAQRPDDDNKRVVAGVAAQGEGPAPREVAATSTTPATLLIDQIRAAKNADKVDELLDLTNGGDYTNLEVGSIRLAAQNRKEVLEAAPPAKPKRGGVE